MSSLIGVEEFPSGEPQTEDQDSSAYNGPPGHGEAAAPAGSRKRVVTIVRRKPKPLKVPKHVYLVKRAPKQGEQLIPSPVHESLPPNYPLSPTEMIKVGPNGNIVEHSILGSIKDLQEMEAVIGDEDDEGEDDATSAAPHLSPKSQRSAASKSLAHKSSRMTALLNASATNDDDELPDPFVDRGRYFRKLGEAAARARSRREQDDKDEQVLMASLPLDERLVVQKERQVLDRWHKRLHDWDSVRQRVSRKVGRREGSLVMSRTDEYREKSEQLDVLQMARPAKEKQGAHYWQMALRDNNERFEVLGSLLSGLYCPIRERSIPPSIIRKPPLPTSLPAALMGAPSSLDRAGLGTPSLSSSKVPDAFKTARKDETAKRLLNNSTRPTARGSKEEGQQQHAGRKGGEGGRERSREEGDRPLALLHWKPSKLIQEAKHRYRKTLSLVRPHEVDEQRLEGLCVEMPDLFEWALESSKEYFKEMDDFDDGAPNDALSLLGGAGAGDGSAGMALNNLSSGGGALDHTMVGPTGRLEMGIDPQAIKGGAVNGNGKGGGAGTQTTDTLLQNSALTGSSSPGVGEGGGPTRTARGPMLEVGPTSHLLFVSTHPTALARNEVVLRNVGSTALFYSLKREETGTTLTDAYRAPARDKVLPPVKPLFSCHGAQGMVLPGASVSVSWSFKAMHTGSFSERWALHTVPKARFHPSGASLEEEGEGQASSRGSKGLSGGAAKRKKKAAAAVQAKPSGVHALFLRGLCTMEDCNEHQRAKLRRSLQQWEWELQVRDVLCDVVSNVRTPRREAVVRNAQREAFEGANRWLGAVYEAGRYDALLDLYGRVRDYLVSVKRKQLQRERDRAAKRNNKNNNGNNGLGAHSRQNSEALVVGPLGQGEEEGVDEEEWLPFQWDGSFASLRAALLDIIRTSHRSLLVSAVGFTLRPLPLPASMLIAQQKDKDKDKEREREKERDAASPLLLSPCSNNGKNNEVGPSHPAVGPSFLSSSDRVVRDVLLFNDELRAHLLHAALRPQEPPLAAALEALSGLGAALVTFAAKAREANGIRPEEVLSPLPSAFTPSGQEAWASVFKAGHDKANPPPMPETKGSKKEAPVAKKEAQKGKKGAAVEEPPPPATPQQLALYRHDLYTSLSAWLTQAAGQFFECALIADDNAARVYRAGKSLSVASKAVLRPSDISGACVLLCVDLDVADFLTMSADGEDWILPDNARHHPHSPFAKAVETIRRVLAHGPTSLIISSHLRQPYGMNSNNGNNGNNGRTFGSNASLGGMSLASAAGSVEATVPPVSLSCLIGVLGEALETSVSFVPYVPASGAFKRGLTGGGVFLLERLECETLVPPLTPPAVPVSDDEDERLPTFEEPLTLRRRLRKEARDRDAAAHPSVGKLLANLVDVMILDDPKGVLDEDSVLLPVTQPDPRWPDQGPRVGVLGGPLLHCELNHLSFFLERALTPRLAILGGSHVFERLRMLDVLIDTVDHIFVGGLLGVNFLAAAGHNVGACQRFVDVALQPLLKDLLNKAQRSPTNLLLPVDLIIGEACVTAEGGVEPPPKPPGQEGEGEEEEEEDEEEEEEGGMSRGQESAVQMGVGEEEEEEEVDPAAGFDYDYETREVLVREGVPCSHYILDIGTHTTKELQSLIGVCRTVFWDGLVGVAECSVAQSGSRAVTSSLMSQHDNTGAVVLVNGGSTGTWARRFANLDPLPDAEGSKRSGDGSGVGEEGEEEEDEEDGSTVALQRMAGFSYVFHESTLARRILSDLSSPLLAAVGEREPEEEELMLAEELRIRDIERMMRDKEERARIRALREATDEEEEGEEEDGE